MNNWFKVNCQNMGEVEMEFRAAAEKDTMGFYTLSHLENGRDVTQRAEWLTLQNASFVRQSRDSFLNAQKLRAW